MKNIFWTVIAWLCTRNIVRRWILESAFRTPYGQIMARNNPSKVYMDRWWLFNPYGKDADGNPTPARWPWLPSIRVHHIARPDEDRHMHDHPWNARTIILRGCYVEERPSDVKEHPIVMTLKSLFGEASDIFVREEGDTTALKVGEYHRIVEVSPGGVYTLFFTFGPYMNWGFNVDGKRVLWREYMGLDK